MTSIDHIRSTPGLQDWSWPRPEMTHTVLDSATGEIIGCLYIYPRKDEPGARVRSWVRADRAGLDAPLYEAVSEWLRIDWPFTSVTYAAR